MAIALELNFGFEDSDGDDATSTIRIPNGFTLAQYASFGKAMSELIDPIVAGRISGADLCLAVDISALTGNVLDPSSDVEEIAAFQFTTGDNRPVNVNIPGMNEAIVSAGSDDIDQADPAVAPFIAAMEVGLATGGGTIQPCDVGEDDIVATAFAREKFRASGKRR